MYRVKTALSLTAGLVALAGFNPALAQVQSDPSAGDGQDGNVIIVTARRQDELLAEVPASVTVFTADMLDRTGVQQADEFVQLTAGVTIVSGTA